MMRSASDVSVSNDAPEMVMIRLGVMKLVDNPILYPIYCPQILWNPPTSATCRVAS